MGTTANLAMVMQRIVPEHHDPGVKAVCLAAACMAGSDGDGRMVWCAELEEKLLSYFPHHPHYVDEAYLLLRAEIGAVRWVEG